MMKIVNGEPRYFSEPPFEWFDVAEIHRTTERINREPAEKVAADERAAGSLCQLAY
jgi:hypothetical protein